MSQVLLSWTPLTEFNVETKYKHPMMLFLLRSYTFSQENTFKSHEWQNQT